MCAAPGEVRVTTIAGGLGRLREECSWHGFPPRLKLKASLTTAT